MFVYLYKIVNFKSYMIMIMAVKYLRIYCLMLIFRLARAHGRLAACSMVRV